MKQKENLIYTNGLGTFWGEDGEEISKIDVKFCFDRGYEVGKAECLEEVEKIIDKLNIDDLVEDCALVYFIKDRLKQKLQRLKDNSPSNVVGKPMTPSATQTSGNVTAVRADTRKGCGRFAYRTREGFNLYCGDTYTTQAQRDKPIWCVNCKVKKLREEKT